MKTTVLTLSLLTLACPVAAWAEGCVYRNDGGNGPEAPYQTVMLFGHTAPAFDPDVPDQTVVYESRGQGDNSWGVATCPTSPNGTAIGLVRYAGFGVYDSRTNTYPTSVKGIGYRISSKSLTADRWWPYTVDYGSGVGRILLGASDYRVQLVKTGPITAKGQLSGDIGSITLAHHGGQVISRIRFVTPLIIEPRVPTCQVTQWTNSVALGSVLPQALDASPWHPITLKLSCSGGSTGASTRMYMAMTDVNNPANLGSQLTLTPGPKTAQGVAVEIRREDDSVVNFGPDSNSRNQWFVGQFGSNVAPTIQLKARYVKTGAQVKPGQANALVTFTMSYQ